LHVSIIPLAALLISGTAMYLLGRTLGRHWSIWVVPCAIFVVGLGSCATSIEEPVDFAGMLIAFGIFYPSALGALLGGKIGAYGSSRAAKTTRPENTLD
jgi:hypothetical protein